MTFIFEFIDGPEMGKQITVKSGDSFGRLQGTYILNDPKVSALHAEIQVLENNQLFLIDKGSSNGIKFENQRVSKLPLKDGLKFILGKSTIFVRSFTKNSDLAPASIEKSKPQSDAQNISNAKTPNEKPITKPTETEKLPWDSFLKKSIRKLNLTNASENIEILPFYNVLTLVFKQGPDAEKEFILGYGPRYFGFQCLDFELSDTNLPEMAFAIAPDVDKNPVLTALNDFPILLNGKTFSSEKLCNKDIVEFGQNIFEVRIDEKK